MIKIQSLQIDEFRGIRSLKLDLLGKNFAISGPNGSGKSGVVDAIDFALTGRIARLEGSGTRDVSLAKHGPHVHRRDDPRAATVSLEFIDPNSGTRATLTRSVATPNNFTLNPDTDTLRALVDECAKHPELTLSRREIIKFVVAKPAEHASQVQALLKLDRLDSYRKLLKSSQNKLANTKKSADDAVEAAESAFKRHLDIQDLLSGQILDEVNKQRNVLGLHELDAVDASTDLSDGMDAEVVTQKFDRATARREVAETLQSLSDTDERPELGAELVDALSVFRADRSLASSLQHRDLVSAGLSALTGSACPLCDEEWESAEALKGHLDAKLKHTDSATESLKRVVDAIKPFRADMVTLRESLRSAQKVNTHLGIKGLDAVLDHEVSRASVAIDALDKTVQAIKDGLDVDAPDLGSFEDVIPEVRKLSEALEMIPDPSKKNAAISFLTVANDRWSAIHVARARQAKVTSAYEVGSTVYNTYCEVSDGALEKLYATAEADFSRFYQLINSDDESAFKAELKPSTGSLAMPVDFYGIGMFPPTAYHSEGHQDGMGVCLYLALVKQLLGPEFSYECWMMW